MISQLTVGPQQNSDGAVVNQRAGKLGDAVLSDLHPRYYEQAYRKNLFYSWAAAQTLAASGTAMTGLILYNGNTGVNAAITKIFVQVIVTSASLTSVQLGWNVQPNAPTSLTVATASGSSLLGAAQSQVKAYNVATVAVAPSVIGGLFHNTAAIATTGVDMVAMDLEGSIILPPNSCLSLMGNAASAASAVNAMILWEESPV